MNSTHCVISNCKLTIFNKLPGITFHSCPSSDKMRKKWLHVLKNKCTVLDWMTSKICSRHFENKYFDSQKNLKEHAFPTLFPSTYKNIHDNSGEGQSRSKIALLLSKQTQAELVVDVKSSLSKLKEPSNLDSLVTDGLKCNDDVSTEAHLWIMIKKQDHLITRLLDQLSKHRKHIEILKENIKASTLSKIEMEQNIETMKYIIKSLQEKHATLEEQIEILTSIEAR